MNELLKGVENRYNRAQTLQVLFNESYTGPGQPRRTESGKLALRKPGRMRWITPSRRGSSSYPMGSGSGSTPLPITGLSG